MKKHLLHIVFLLNILSTIFATAQNNLVADPSMEIHYYVPHPIPNQYCDSLGIYSTHWRSPNSKSPDYIHANIICNFPWWPYSASVPWNGRGWQWPKEGKAYYFLGTFSYFESHDTTRQNESIIGDLIQPLEAGKTYCLSFYLTQADVFNLTMDQIGIFFSKTDYYTSLPTIDSIPQLVIRFGEFFTDTANWVLFSGKYTATGGEKYITFGTFEAQKPYSFGYIQPTDSCTYPPCWPSGCGIFIDMVSLYDCTGFYYEADAGENTGLCKGEEIILGWDVNTNRSFKWSVVSGDSASLINDSIPRPTVSPQENTVYALCVTDEYLQQHYDTIAIEVINCESPMFVPNIFSPNGDGQNDVLYVRSTYIQELKDFRVYNRWGEQIFQCHAEPGRSTALEDCGWDGKYHGENMPVGVYAYYVEAVLLNGETVIKRGNVTLVR